MAKKTDSTTKPIAAVKPAAEPPKPPAKAPAKKKPAAKKAKAPAGKSAKKTAKPAKPAYTHADVALRAYFIAEKRHAHGLPGNEHLDWLEAERQLAKEHARPKRLKKA